MKRDPEVASDQGKVVGRALDRIHDFHTRTLAMVECLAILKRWNVQQEPARVSHGNVIVFPRQG